MSLIDKIKARRIERLKQKLAKFSETENKQEDIPEVTPGTEGHNIIAWDKVTKLSEELNDCNWDFTLYFDTTKLVPGFIVYVVGTRPPTTEKPYVTYKPEPRVIFSIHDSGVNGGTVFFTYSHRIEKPQSITKGEKDFQVVSEVDIIYSPLTKEHAERICKLLNLQSKRLFEKNLLKIKEQQNQQ